MSEPTKATTEELLAALSMGEPEFTQDELSEIIHRIENYEAMAEAVKAAKKYLPLLEQFMQGKPSAETRERTYAAGKELDAALARVERDEEKEK